MSLSKSFKKSQKIMQLINIPSLINNYIWMLHNNRQSIIVDPGESEPVLHTLEKLNLTPIAILLTHNHNDHTNGIPKILEHYNIPVYGPKETKYKGSNIIITDKETLHILNLKFNILSLPGHTLGHIGFYSHPWLFCGDTVFSAGCGRIIKNAEKIMYQSLQKIKQLNKNVLICSAHEYTLSNIKFAMSIMPEDMNLIIYKQYIEKIQIEHKQPSFPTTLKNELKINLFFRCNETTLKTKLMLSPQEEEWKVFSKLRKMKNNFL